MIVLAMIGLAPEAYADPVACETPLVLVETDDMELHERICTVVEQSLPALAECKLEPKLPVTISFSVKLKVAEEVCLGLYHTGKNEINLLEPDAFTAAHNGSKIWSAIALSQHFDSLVVHELAHALFDQSTNSKLACGVDQEYVAYAFQLASLTASTRNEFLTSAGVAPPVSVEGINQVILGLSPSSFAARSWLHFSQPENGCDFVEKIIRGETSLWLDPE